MGALLGAFILLALAVYRVALLLTREDGPFKVLLRLRIRLGAYDYDADGEPKTELGKLFSCPYCLGFWLAIGATVFLYFVPLLTLNSAWLVVIALALAGAQTLLQRANDALERRE